MSESKEKKCILKCNTCEYYNKSTDFCVEKSIENCSKAATQTDFSQCETYLVSSKLVMF